MFKRQLLTAIAEQLNTAIEEEITAKRFSIMRKALYLLSPEDREEIDRVIRIERGHLSPELEAAWRKALKQAEDEGIEREQLSPELVAIWQKALKQAESELR